jgi:hypothetical protein
MSRFEGTLYTEMIFTNTPTLKSLSPPPYVQCFIKFKFKSAKLADLRVAELICRPLTFENR